MQNKKISAEILCIGTEVLIGDIVNTNAAYLGAHLSAAGVNVYHHTVCGDNAGRIKECLALALSRNDLVVTTGGLGPTYDDITKEIVAEYFGLPLEEHAEVLGRITAYFTASGRAMTENNRKQALIPKGAHILVNNFGTADGIAVTVGEKTVIMLPGPPREMKPMFDNEVLPYLKALGISGEVLVSSNVNIFGMGESSVEAALADLMKNSKNPTVAPYVGSGEVRLRVTASGKDEDEAQSRIAPVVKQIVETLGNAVYGVDEPSLEAVLVKQLAEKGMTVAFAESCTGGLISERLTAIPGASEVFGFGFATYANEAKVKLLGVSPETLEKYGAVSEQTACEMARGALEVSGADIAISVTGIAGPDGGTAEKPVGLVYMGVAAKGKDVFAKKLLLARHCGHDRAYVRTLAANHAFKAAAEEIRNKK